MVYRQTRRVGNKKIEVGTLIIDWRRKGVGRIKKSSGTDSTDIKNRYTDLLDRLYSAGKLEALIALKNNKVTFAELFDWERNNTGSTPPWEQYNKSINEYISSYYATGNRHNEGQGLSPRTIVGYKNCINQLLKNAKSDISLKDLPQLLKDYQKLCSRNKVWRTFNQTRAVCLGLVRHAIKNTDAEIYREIKNIGLLKQSDITKVKENNPFTVNELDKAFSRKNVDERLRNTVWFMCLTGMGPKEYLEDGWSVTDNIVTIYGRKRSSRVRKVPLVYKGLEQKKWCEYRKLLLDFKSMFPDRTLYDCRRTFKTWCNAAGVDYIQSTIMMGHTTSISYKDGYGKIPERRWLADAGKKLYRYIVEQQITIEAPDIDQVNIPNAPWENKTNIHNEKLKKFYQLLDGSLKKWYDEGKMKRLYRVEKLVEIK